MVGAVDLSIEAGPSDKTKNIAPIIFQLCECKGHRMNRVSELRKYISALQSIGELQEIDQTVDSQLE